MDIFSVLGGTVVGKMLMALTIDDIILDDKHDIPSRDQQIWYIKKMADSLTLEGKRAIGNILIMNNKKCELKDCNDGTIINLDNLPKNILEHLYIFITYKTSNV